MIDKRTTIYSSTFGIATKVDMYLGAGTARTCIAHLPEVVFAISVDDVVGRKVFLPIAGSFVVALQTFGFIAFKHSCIQTVGAEFQYIYQVFPSPVNSLFLEVVAK